MNKAKKELNEMKALLSKVYFEAKKSQENRKFKDCSDNIIKILRTHQLKIETNYLTD